MDGSPPKAPRLELPDYARGDDAAEQESEEPCIHFLAVADKADALFAEIKARERAPDCEHCWLEAHKRDFERAAAAAAAVAVVAGGGGGGGGKENPGKRQREEPRTLMMVCLDCSRSLCAGAGAATTDDKPGGHAWFHARKKSHWVALWFDKPDEAYCFLCADGVCFQEAEPPPPPPGDRPATGVLPWRPDPNELGYVVRGIPNCGSTCYVNALVQCLLVLAKLRMWMLAPDAPSGFLGGALRELFIRTSARNDDAGGVLNPAKLLRSLGALNARCAGQGVQEDSHELLVYVRKGLNEEEMQRWPPWMRERAITVVDSIFQGQICNTLTCKCCLFGSPSHVPFSELSLPMPSKGQTTESFASPQRSPAIEESDGSKKAQTDAEVADSVAMDKVTEPLEDSSEAEQIQESKSDAHGTPKDKGKGLSRDIVCDEKENSNTLASIKHCLALYFKDEEVEWRCVNCSKVPEGAEVSCSTANEESDRDSKAEKKIDLLSVQDSQDASTVDQEDQVKQIDLNSAPQEKENKNEQIDRNWQTTVITKLPHVLTVHLKRFVRDNNMPVKVTGHVSFEENLDVGEFMDASSEGRDKSTYGLVGVIEHIGDSVNHGHYVAYVRASSTGSQQQSGSGSSSWFRASDENIKEVSLEEVLKCEAFVLFYERMKG